MDIGLRCPRCGSIDIGRKGYLRRINGTVRQYQCKDCGYRFPEVSSRRWKSSRLPPDLLRLYLSYPLSEIKEMQDFPISTTTISLELQRKQVADWRTLLWDMDLRQRWSLILGLDTTGIKISGKPYVYFHCADILSKLPLAYEILPDRKAVSIENILWQIRSAGYYPKIIVTDLAPELLEAIKRVYPDALVQGCLFHLRKWLDENLPTKRRRVDPETFQKWVMVKKLIMHIALAYSRDRQKLLVNNLLGMYSSLDEAAKNVVRLFVNNWLRYYHPMEELEKLGCSKKHAYNNVCERHMGNIKELERRKRGFKNLERARKYIYALWYYKILDEKSEQSRVAEEVSPNDHEEKLIDLKLLIFVSREILDLEDLSETTMISKDLLTKRLEEQGLVVTAKYAFTKYYAETIVKRILNKKPHQLKEAAEMVDLDPHTLYELLRKFGVRVLFKTLYIDEAIIVYP